MLVQNNPVFISGLIVHFSIPEVVNLSSIQIFQAVAVNVIFNLIVVALGPLHVAVHPEIISAQLIHVEKLQTRINLTHFSQVVEDLDLLARFWVAFSEHLFVRSVPEFCIVIQVVWPTKLICKTGGLQLHVLNGLIRGPLCYLL